MKAIFGFGNSVDEIELQSGEQNTSTTVFAMGIGPGFTIFSRDAIGIEALVKYNWASSNTDISFQGVQMEAQTITNQIDFSVGLQFYFTRLKPVGPTPLRIASAFSINQNQPFMDDKRALEDYEKVLDTVDFPAPLSRMLREQKKEIQESLDNLKVLIPAYEQQ